MCFFRPSFLRIKTKAPERPYAEHSEADLSTCGPTPLSVRYFAHLTSPKYYTVSIPLTRDHEEEYSENLQARHTQSRKTPFVCCSSFPFLALCCQPHFTLHRRNLSPTGSSLMTSAALLLLIRIYDYEIFIRSGRYTSRMLSDISSPISPSARRISI